MGRSPLLVFAAACALCACTLGSAAPAGSVAPVPVQPPLAAAIPGPSGGAAGPGSGGASPEAVAWSPVPGAPGTTPGQAAPPAPGSTPGATSPAAPTATAPPTAPSQPRPTLAPTPRPTAAPTPTAAATPVPTAVPTPAPVAAGAPSLGGCPLFPADNVWNEPVDQLPVAANSATLVASIGASANLHPDFGSYAGYGIPYNLVGASTPGQVVAFDYASESDPGPYPIPTTPLIEAGSDHHILVVATGTCTLYELWDARQTASGWAAGSGATWSLRSNALRPAGWTSADAAGLPILPGLVRYDEVAAGFIGHAIRFTAPQTRRAYIYPARHFASSSTSAALPPMGTRLRLDAAYDISTLPPQARVIAQAMKTYGIILADNGSPWFFQGASDARFSDTQLNALKAIPGSAFRVVDTTGFVNGP